MEFKRRKDEIMAGMDSAERDKSSKGSVDAPIISLLHTINSHPSYFTTSSCSGRTSLFAHPPTPSNSKKKSKGGSWLFVTHHIADPSPILDLLFPPPSPPHHHHSHLVFRFEPLIIAVDCKDVASASLLVSLAISSGFRESGITSVSHKRVMVGIRCSLRLEVPLGDAHPLMVSPDYIRFLVGVANEKMEVNWRRIDSFLEALLRNGFGRRMDCRGEEDLDNEGFGEKYDEEKDEDVEEDEKNEEFGEKYDEEKNEEIDKDVEDGKNEEFGGKYDVEKNEDVEENGKNEEFGGKYDEEKNEDVEEDERNEEFGEKYDEEKYEEIDEDVEEDKNVECGKDEERVEECGGNGEEDDGRKADCGEEDDKIGEHVKKNLENDANNSECEKEDEENEECEEEGEYETEKVIKNAECEKEEDKKYGGRKKEDVFHIKEGWSISERDRRDHALVGSQVLRIIPIPVYGDHLEKLMLWGHSSVVLSSTDSHKVFIFGGFGGAGTHSRKNDSLLLDPTSGVLATVETADSPSPRLGHTASLVGESIFIVGGRASLSKIMNDVWVLPSIAARGWRRVECGGCFFNPRHRHAAAVVGLKIYIFGGVENGTVYSSFHVLDTETFFWEELRTKGDGPGPRHSHTMVAYGSLLFLFGGNDGKSPLGDLYSFNTETCRWKVMEEMSGKPPQPRFSHTMFMYKHFLGILGGCPITSSRELSLLDLKCGLWRHMELDFIGMHLFVRTTAVVSVDKLVLVGGGSSCFAFGSYFTQPSTINLLPVEGITAHPTEHTGGFSEFPPSCWMVRVERKYAKLLKDELKKSGWLDPRRKTHLQNCGEYVCLPITEKFPALFNRQEERLGNEGGDLGGSDWLGTCPGGIFRVDDHLRAIDIITKYAGCVIRDDDVEFRRSPRSPLKVMVEALTSLINRKGMPMRVLQEIPTRWEKLGDIIVLPVSAFRDPAWDVVQQDLWPIVAKSLNVHRLARQGCVVANGTRDSTLEILIGDDGWVDHYENGIRFAFDATRCIFSRGNRSERLRVANMDCRDEVVVDLFAGIGYFVLPFLLRAKAKHVFACEWNPSAVEALRRNLNLNSVADRCVILEGDNRLFAPTRVADRVCLGLLPTSEGSWVTAVRALRHEGGVLHVHGNVNDKDEASWVEGVSRRIHDISVGEGCEWVVRIEHLQRVKWYAPHVRHLVADVRCSKVTP